MNHIQLNGLVFSRFLCYYMQLICHESVTGYHFLLADTAWCASAAHWGALQQLPGLETRWLKGNQSPGLASKVFKNKLVLILYFIFYCFPSIISDLISLQYTPWFELSLLCNLIHGLLQNPGSVRVVRTIKTGKWNDMVS